MKTTVLFLAASPDDETKLALDKECRAIHEKIRASDFPNELELKTEWAVRPDDLLQYLNEHCPHVVHFSGHGSTSEELILHDEYDQAKPVSLAALRALFTTLKDNIRLLVLNACYSCPQAEAIVEIIDCAVGMNKAIGDQAAIVFAASFYRALGFGKSVKEAFEQGCTALLLEGIPEENTPELLVKKGVDAGKVFFAGAAANPKEPNQHTPEIQAPIAPVVIPADISRIDKYAPAELIGRKDETQLLNDAWDKAVKAEAKRPHILTFVALGGEGKTSLVAKWAAELAHNNWPGCEAVFAWSFYSQGIRESASSDLFLTEALAFFGDAEMAESSKGAFDKGKRLAQLIGARRVLLILDGVEPLQYPPMPPMDGKLKDDGLAALLKGLAANSLGLCVVTTRYSITDLKAHWQGNAPEVTLKRLSKEAGVELLKLLGVNGTQKEFEILVEDIKGHALTLNLLGSYLHDAHAGDIRKRDLVKLEEADAEEQGGHAFRVIDAYVQWFEADRGSTEENKKAQRALAVLRLMGLFDRPASADCFAALLKAPPIKNLTELLVEKNEAKRNMALTRLEDAKLLTVNRDMSGTLLSLDTHPLLREYFAKQLREQHPGSWREAHRRIYKHLCATANEGKQPTLEKLQPLYQAVAHGCQASMLREACDKVYFARILRGNEAYSLLKLGAFASDLGAVANFFETLWHRVSPAFTKAEHALLLHEAAFRLRALGRLEEALEPMRAALNMRIKQKAWKRAAIVSSNMSELELTLGEMAKAKGYAEQSVTYAERDEDKNWLQLVRTTHADVLHQSGSQAEAEALFLEAETRQAEYPFNHPLLYSLWGFRYCDLLLVAPERDAWLATIKCGDSTTSNAETAGKSGDMSPHSKALLDVSQRAMQTLNFAEQRKLGFLAIAFDHLTLGRVALYIAILDGSTLAPCILPLDHAVDCLHNAGTQDHIPRALLTRAWLRSLEGNHTGPDSAQADLDEAWEIAERGPMPLFMADIHLHRARLFFRTTPYPWHNPDGTPRGAKDDLAEARRLIEKHGYWRRKEELEDAERVIGK